MTGINEVCDSLYLSVFKDFASHSTKWFSKYFNKEGLWSLSPTSGCQILANNNNKK